MMASAPVVLSVVSSTGQPLACLGNENLNGMSKAAKRRNRHKRTAILKSQQSSMNIEDMLYSKAAIGNQFGSCEDVFDKQAIQRVEGKIDYVLQLLCYLSSTGGCVARSDLMHTCEHVNGGIDAAMLAKQCKAARTIQNAWRRFRSMSKHQHVRFREAVDYCEYITEIADIHDANRAGDNDLFDWDLLDAHFMNGQNNESEGYIAPGFQDHCLESDNNLAEPVAAHGSLKETKDFWKNLQEAIRNAVDGLLEAFCHDLGAGLLRFNGPSELLMQIERGRGDAAMVSLLDTQIEHVYEAIDRDSIMDMIGDTVVYIGGKPTADKIFSEEMSRDRIDSIVLAKHRHVLENVASSECTC